MSYQHRPCVVYALTSSRDHRVRYIGQTTQEITKRLDSHIHANKSARHRYINRWIAKERSEGYQIHLVTLVSDAVWQETEKRLIAAYRTAGARLVNVTDGGEGILGRARTDEERRKISEAHKGRKKSPEHMAKILAFNATRRGQKWRPEQCAKLSAVMKGKRPKNLESLWEKSRGRPWTPQQREATMAAHRAKKERRLRGLDD